MTQPKDWTPEEIERLEQYARPDSCTCVPNDVDCDEGCECEAHR